MSLPILDVAIGLSFIYLLLALVCTSVNELIAGALNKRGKFLECGILRLLSGDANLKSALYDHPLIQGTTASGKRVLPAYISPRRFTAALLDHLTGENGSRFNAQDLKLAIDRIENPELKVALRSLAPIDGEMDPAKFHISVEEWFNEGMDRVSGWYKRNSQFYVLILAATITILLNADTLNIARVLWVNPTLRAQFVAEAEVRANQSRPEALLPLVEYRDPDDPTKSEALVSGQAGLSNHEIDLLTQVMGWGNRKSDPNVNWKMPVFWLGLFANLVGWMITTAALSLGGPFWFDLLNRFINIRNAGRSPNEARDKTAPVTK